MCYTECPVGIESVYQLPAFIRVCLIKYGHADIAHICGNNISECKQLKERGNQQQGQILLFPKER